MANDARISIFGTVVQDPTNRQVNSTTVFTMRVAVQTTKKQEGSQWPASDLYEVSVWGKPGENLMGKIKTKSKVWVTGDFMLGEPWQDRQGKEHQSLRVNASHVKILSGGTYNGNSNNNNNNNQNNEEVAPF